MKYLHIVAGPHPSPVHPIIRRVDPADINDALTKGVNDFIPLVDFLGKTLFAVLFSIIYAVLCIYLMSAGLPLLFPFMSGFALIAPFIAISFFEVSRRRELGLDTSWARVLELRHLPSIPSILALGAVLLILFLGWLAAADELYLWLFGPTMPESLNGFLVEVLTTSRGWALILFGNAIGLVFALLVLSISVVSFPLLLDRNVGVVAAVRASVRAVWLNPLTMTLWGLVVAACLAAGFILAFVGLAFAVPVLAHANWHLYRRVVQ